jgi:hypothetical protein
MRESDVEAVTAFARRFCAVENGEEPEAGYFAFQKGKARAKAKKAAPRMPNTFNFEQLGPAILRRVKHLADLEQGNVWLLYYFESDTSPVDYIKISAPEHRDEDDEDEDDTAGSAVAALTQAMVRTNRMLLDDNRQLRDNISQSNALALQSAEELVFLKTQAVLVDSQAGAAQMEAAMQALAPTIEKVAPKLVEALGAWVSGKGGGELPPEPRQRMNALAARMIASAQEIGQLASEHPAESVEAIPPLIKLLEDIAPRLGFQLVPMQPAGAPA